MAEWLRRLTRNQLGSSRVGSNPTRSVILSTFYFYVKIVQGVYLLNLQYVSRKDSILLNIITVILGTTFKEKRRRHIRLQ